MTTITRNEPPIARLRAPRQLRVPLIVGLGGFLLSEIGNWIPSPWYDEAATITSATRSWSQLWLEVQNIDAVHATYYGLMHVVFAVFGYSPFTLRLPSAIAVGLTAALIVVLVRRLSDARLALIAGALYCVIPRVTWMGGEGRSYAFSALLFVVLALVLTHALRDNRRRWWVLYAAFAVLSCLVFIYLALVIIAHGVTLIATKGHRRSLRSWVTAACAAGILLLPFALLVHSEQGQIKWIAPISTATVRQILVTQWFWGTWLLPIIGWLLIIAGGYLLVRHRPTLAALVLPAVVLPTALLILVSIVYSPLYSPRYLAMCTPAVAIAMAVALDRIRRPALVIAVFLLIAALAVPHIATAQRIPSAKQKSSWSSVAALVDSRADDLTGIVYGPLRYHRSATTRAIEYAYPAAFEGTTDITLAVPAAETGRLWETRQPLETSLDRTTGLDRILLVTSTKRDRRASTTATLAETGWSVTGTWHFTDVNIVEYSKNGTIGS